MLSWPTGWFEKPAHVYDPVSVTGLIKCWSPLTALPQIILEAITSQACEHNSLLLYLAGNEQNYGKSEAVARQTGVYLTTTLQSLSGEYSGGLHVVAHSMGNVVVSEALRHAGNISLLASYSPSESATVAGAYTLGAPPVRHKLKIYPEWAASGDGADGLYGAELAWRQYNVTNSPETDFDMPPDHYRVPVGNPHGGTSQVDVEAQVTLANSQTEADEGSQPEPGMARPYYKSGGIAAGRVINYFNPGDAALNGWEFGQLTKPDFLGGDEWRYSNTMYECYFNATEQEKDECRMSLSDVDSRYLKGDQLLHWEHAGLIGSSNKNAEILAHIIPARTHALGQYGGGGGMLEDSSEIDYGTSNQGHSAQFYSTYAERQGYWRGILARSLGFVEASSVLPGEVIKYSALHQGAPRQE
jgi:hypothetical protein